MKKHYNLFYLFLKDQENNLLSKEKGEEIRKIIEAFFVRMRKSVPELPTNMETDKE